MGGDIPGDRWKRAGIRPSGLRRKGKEAGTEKGTKKEGLPCHRPSLTFRQLSRKSQTEKELPHPQELFAFGFLMANPDP